MMESIAAVMFGANQPLDVTTISVDAPKDHEVLVEVKASGICHSDYNSYVDSSTPCPMILGHEGAGIVREVGKGVTAVAPGDHVALSWLPYCGHCHFCKKGKVVLCETVIAPLWNGTQFDGTTRFHLGDQDVFNYSCLSTFSQFTVVHEHSCIKIPEAVPFQQAALIGCGIATGYGAAVYAGGITQGDSVAIFGIGGVGIAAIQGARIQGAEVLIAIDVNPRNKQAAMEMGATHFLSPEELVLHEEVQSLTHGYGVDVAIDCTGVPHVFTQAFECVCSGGSVIVAGAYPGNSLLSIPGGGFHRKEKKIRGTFYGSIDPKRDLLSLAELYLEGELYLDNLLLGEIGLVDVEACLRSFESREKANAGRKIVLFD